MADRNLLLRAASALVAIPILFALVLWHQTLGFALLVLVALALGLGELGKLTLGDQSARARAVLVVLGCAFGVAVYLWPGRAFVFGLGAVVLTALDVLASRPTDLPAASRRLGYTVFGIFYLGGLLTTLPLLRRDLPHGAWWVIAVFVLTFANDTGAYFAGRALGRHKLAPTISPGKTVEGAIGGLLFGVGILLAYRALFFPALRVVDAVVIAVVGGVLGPAGDLTESMLKRAAGAKDSGHLIPGHGGVLDRIDALLFIGAYVYVHAQLFR